MYDASNQSPVTPKKKRKNYTQMKKIKINQIRAFKKYYAILFPSRSHLRAVVTAGFEGVVIAKRIHKTDFDNRNNFQKF